MSYDLSLYVKDQNVLSRFLSKIAFCEHGRECKVCCWLWIGARVGIGYGQFFLCGSARLHTQVKVPAHFFMYCLEYGSIANYGKGGKHTNILHSCDRPACCNFHHLFDGTHQDNMDDMQEKGRDNYRVGVKIPYKDLPRIFQLSKEGWSQADIGKIWKVHNSTISAILLGKKRKGYVNES